MMQGFTNPAAGSAQKPDEARVQRTLYRPICWERAPRRSLRQDNGSTNRLRPYLLRAGFATEPSTTRQGFSEPSAALSVESGLREGAFANARVQRATDGPIC